MEFCGLFFFLQILLSPDREVGEVGELAELVVDLPDPVEPHVECGEAGETVDDGRDLGESVVPAVENSEVVQVAHAVGKAGDDVLAQGQRQQGGETANLNGEGRQTVGVQIKLWKRSQLLERGRQHKINAPVKCVRSLMEVGRLEMFDFDKSNLCWPSSLF